MLANQPKNDTLYIKGFNIVVENRAFTYRQVAQNVGQKACLMPAHYGYLQNNPKVGVFVGAFPENDTVYLINQKAQGGYFDKHIAMFGFLSEQQAVDTYQKCFEYGYIGLMSVVPCTIEQLKWWLANGDKSRPVTKERLPYAGLERLDSVLWGGEDKADLASHSGQVAKLLYQIRQSDSFNHALEPLSYHDLTQELGNQGFVYENYDALVVEYNKLERKAKQMLMAMQGAADIVKPVGVAVSKPLNKGGVSNVVAWFEMEDGQAVGVFFHNPDKTPKKIDPTDEMISYKWVLNKKDITIVVAPENGKDLVIRTVAKRIMKLVDANHNLFLKANSDKAELNLKEQNLGQLVIEKQAELDALNKEIELLEAQKAEKEANKLKVPTGEELRQQGYNGVISELKKLGWTDDSVTGGLSKSFIGANEKGTINPNGILNVIVTAKDANMMATVGGDTIVSGSTVIIPQYGVTAQTEESYKKEANTINNAVEAYVAKQRELVTLTGKELEVVAEEDVPVEENEDELKRIASLYSAEWGWPLGNKRSLEFASAVLAKDAYALEFMANGFNDKSKKVFSEVTGVSLPKQQVATWKAIRDWAGVSDEQENYRVAVRDVAYEVKAFMRDNDVSQEMADKNKALIASKIAEGFNSIEKIGNNYWFTDGKGQGINLSEKPRKGYLGLSKSRALVEAMILENKAKLALFAPTIVSTSQPESTTEERPANWRTNLANARAVAKSLGIETKGKKLNTLLKEIDVFDEKEVKKELLAEFKGLASRLVLPKGYIFDLSDAEKSIGDITRSTAAWIRKQGKIDTNTIRVELRTIPDSSQGVIFNSVHIYTDDPKTKKVFDKFSYQRFGDIGASSPETPKEIIAKMELYLTKFIFPEIEYQKVVNSKAIEPSQLSKLGMANIESIGDENVYIEKDGKYYISKVGNTEDYALGEWDFAKYPDGVVSQATEPKQPESEPPTVANGKIYDYLKEMGKPDSKVEFDDDYMVLVAIATRDINNPMEDFIDDEYDLEKISKRLTPHKEPLFREAMANFKKKVIAEQVAAENPDRDYLQSIIDGQTDALTVDIDDVIALAEKYDGDAEVTALVEQALEVVNNAELQAAKGV